MPVRGTVGNVCQPFPRTLATRHVVRKDVVAAPLEETHRHLPNPILRALAPRRGTPPTSRGGKRDNETDGTNPPATKPDDTACVAHDIAARFRPRDTRCDPRDERRSEAMKVKLKCENKKQVALDKCLPSPHRVISPPPRVVAAVGAVPKVVVRVRGIKLVGNVPRIN